MIFFSFFHLFVRFCFLFFEMPVSFFIVSWAQRHLFIQLGSFLFGECFKISINSCIVLYVLCSNDGINGKNRRWSQWFFIFNLFCCGLLYFWFCLCFLQWVNSTNEMLIHNKTKNRIETQRRTLLFSILSRFASFQFDGDDDISISNCNQASLLEDVWL